MRFPFVMASLRWLRSFSFLSPRLRARVRRESPLLGVVLTLLVGQIVGGIPGSTPVVGLGIGLVAVGVGIWRDVERLVVGALVGIVGVATTLATLPRSVHLPADTVWRGEIEEAPRYPKTGAVSLTIRAVAEDGGIDTVEPIRLVCTAVDLPWRNIAGVERGDLILFRGTVTPLEVTADPFAYSNLLRRRGVSANCRITHATPVLRRVRSDIGWLRKVIETRVEHLVGGGERWGLLLAMSIGSRDTLSIDTERAFKATGLSHLLVVSGFQVTLVYYVVTGILVAVLSRVRRLFVWLPAGGLAQIVGIAASLSFVLLSGIDGSSLRAAFAAVFAVIARSIERGGGLFNGIVVSLLGVSLVWPGAILEPGVELTYAALCGICLGRDIFPRRSARLGFIASAFGVTLGVWLLSSIVSLGWFRSFSPVGLLLNPLLAPVLGFVGCHGAFAGFLAHVSGLDSSGVLLRVVGDVLIAGRDLVVLIARSGFVVPELSPTAAAVNAGVLGIISARLLHVCLRGRFVPQRDEMSEDDRDGVFESRLSEWDRSATLKG